MRFSLPLAVGTVVTIAAITFRLWVDPEAQFLLNTVTWSMIVGGIGVSLCVGSILKDHFAPIEHDHHEQEHR